MNSSSSQAIAEPHPSSKKSTNQETLTAGTCFTGIDATQIILTVTVKDVPAPHQREQERGQETRCPQKRITPTATGAYLPQWFLGY